MGVCCSPCLGRFQNEFERRPPHHHPTPKSDGVFQRTHIRQFRIENKKKLFQWVEETNSSTYIVCGYDCRSGSCWDEQRPAAQSSQPDDFTVHGHEGKTADTTVRRELKQPTNETIPRALSPKIQPARKPQNPPSHVTQTRNHSYGGDRRWRHEIPSIGKFADTARQVRYREKKELSKKKPNVKRIIFLLDQKKSKGGMT